MAVDTVTGAVVDKLKNEVSVTTLTTNITANVADQLSTQSASTYMIVVLDSIDNEYTKNGTGISVVDVGVEIYHEDIKDATDLASAVDGVLTDYTGTHGSIKIQEMWHVNSIMAFDAETEKHAYRMQFRIRHDKS